MEHFKTNIALVPKATAFEKGVGIFIVALMFIPFAIGIFTTTLWLLAGLPTGVLLLFVLNFLNKGKFNPKNWIQKDYFVDVTLSGISIIGRDTQKDFLWSDITDVQFKVEAFDKEVEPATNSDDSDTHFSGTENKLLFNAGGTQYEFNFYLENVQRKDAIRGFLQREELRGFNITLTSRGVSKVDVAVVADEPEKETVSQKRKKYGCLILFFAPFVLVGLGTFFMSLYQFGKVIQAKGWVPVEAKVLSLDIIWSESSETSTSTIKMEYAYVVGAETFTGTRVSFSPGSTNVEDHGALYDALNHSRVIRIYVNKNDPTESVVIRGVTNGIVFIALFSIMWNALLMVFLLPMVYKKAQPQKLLVITVIIWVLGFSKFIFSIGDIDMAGQLYVIEERGDNDLLNKLPE